MVNLRVVLIDPQTEVDGVNGLGFRTEFSDASAVQFDTLCLNYVT